MIIPHGDAFRAVVFRCPLVLLLVTGTCLSSLLAAPPGVTYQLIAHRGGIVDEDHIENSLPAVREAVRRKYWMLEVDLRQTKDGKIIVHHDEDFERYYGDTRRVDELTWSEIKELRSKPSNLRPVTFAEFAAACRGKIRLMLDVKGEHDKAFYDQLRETLRENELLTSCYVLGPEQARRYFQEVAKVSTNGQALRAAIDRGEDVSARYYLFGIPARLSDEDVKLAQKHNVVVVPAINRFRYEEETHRQQAAADIRRMQKSGVVQFQIDSQYDDLFLPKL